MENNKLLQANLLKGLLAIFFALALFALTPQLASAQTSCLPSAGSCTAGDLPPLTITSVTDVQGPCTDLIPTNGAGVLEIKLDISYQFNTGANTRYDLGFFLSRDGQDVLVTSDCAIDYLVPPLTITRPGDNTAWPVNGYFWDAEDAVGAGDECGDVSKYDTASRTLNDVTVTCVDTNGNGQIDVSICQVYDNNQQNVCGATNPGTGSKCDCVRMDLPITPTAIEGLSFSASSQALPVGLALGGVGLLLIAGVMLSVYLRRRAHA